MPFAVGSLVWARWRDAWYMGQVVEHDGAQIQIHIHGEPEPRDKWYRLDSTNLVELVAVDAPETAVGVFPQAGDRVELLVLDAPLARSYPNVLLTGSVLRVYPARDASMVEVDYPADDAFVPLGRRRVCVGNGYLRVRRNYEPPGPSSPAT